MAAGKYVFISYSSKDIVFVNTIVTILKQMGIPYWKAPDMIPAGSNYAREIPNAIMKCEVFLLVLSAASQQSIWVEKEVDSAVRNRKVIIPLQIDATPMSEMFLFYLNNVQMISYSENPQKAVEQMKSQLKPLFLEKKEVTKDSAVLQKNDVDKKPTPLKGEKQISGSGISSAKAKRINALSINKIPVECRYCKGSLTQVETGTYRCNQCGKDNYDDFQTVRNYLEENGPTPAVIIERETGVSRRVIKYFFEQEFLEIPKLSSIRLSCMQCGAPIRTGVICDNCKWGGNTDEKSGRNRDTRGTWHTKW